MDFDRFTEKARSAVMDSQNIAIENGHPQLDGEHLHLALLQQDQGLIGKLLANMGVSRQQVESDVIYELSKLPKISGNGQLYASPRINKIFMDAEKIAQNFKDEFVSVEHLYIALLEEKGTPSAQIFRKYGITKDSFLQALMKVRGNQRVTSSNPEDNYDALNKYGRDLVEDARAGKLDPV
ncbi:MAG: type VI secretion system ATPase TssH, partial [Firmicutes bacterium]|nr:type VI secretion system ATPase TssH [Bacillota bacterium]